MKIEPWIWIPAFSGFVYSIAAILIKTAIEKDVGPWRTTFVSNILMAAVMVPFALWGSPEPSWPGFFAAVLIALCFFLGQIGTFMAMTVGDISVATPVMGSKIILVAIFLRLFLHERPSPTLWAGAFLATLAVVLLQFGGGSKKHRATLTVCTALATAALFAMTDILTQKFVPLYGSHFVLPVMFASVAAMSFGLIPFFHAPLTSITREGWKWLLAGCILLAIQAMGMSICIGFYGHATEANIIYSIRGLFSVLIIWMVGHWFSNHEGKVGHGVMALRLVGAILLLSAVVTVFI